MKPLKPDFKDPELNIDEFLVEIQDFIAEHMTKKEQEVLKVYFESLDQVEAAKKLNCTKAYISFVFVKLKEKIKKYYESE